MVSVRKSSLYLYAILTLFTLAEMTDGLICYGLLFLTALVTGYFCIKFRKGLFVMLFLFLALQKGVQRITLGTSVYKPITYVDEVTEVIMILYIIYNFIIRKIPFKDTLIFLTYFAYLFLCVVSSLNVPSISIINKILEFFVTCKFMVFYFGGYLLAYNGRFTKQDINEIFVPVAKYFTILCSILITHDFFFTPIFKKYDFRYFTRSFELYFQHPTYLAAACFTFALILMLGIEYDKSCLFYLVLITVCIMLTFRTKAMATIGLVWIIYIFFIRFHFPLKAVVVAFMAVGAWAFGKDQVKFYFTQVHVDMPIRLKMTIDGIDIAKQYFPFGAGYATFGTQLAYDTHSPFYRLYGYTRGYYATQPSADTFWPGIMAESGFIGTIFFLICISLMLLKAFRYLKVNMYSGWVMISIMLYAIIASSSETAFFNPATSLMFIIFGILAFAKVPEEVQVTDEQYTENQQQEKVYS